MARLPFNWLWASNPAPDQFEEPPQSTQQSGWVGGAQGQLPEAKWENYWHHRVDAALQEIERFGCLRWHEDAIYSTGAVVLGSDGKRYEFYDRDLAGTVQGVDPTNSANRPHIWMLWDGVKPGSTIEWRSVTLPEGYIENDGSTISRSDYRRVFAVLGTTYGAGNGSTTFRLPDDRGEFKRGLDRGRGVDAGRTLVAQQGDALQNVTGILGARPRGIGAGRGAIVSASGAFRVVEQSLPGDYANITADLEESSLSDEVTFDMSRVARTSSETRPRNNAVVYLTKI